MLARATIYEFAPHRPPGMRKSIITTLNTEIVRLLQSADVRERMLREGAQPIVNTPEQFTAFLAEDQRNGRKSSNRRIPTRRLPPRFDVEG